MSGKLPAAALKQWSPEYWTNGGCDSDSHSDWLLSTMEFEMEAEVVDVVELWESMSTREGKINQLPCLS